MEFQKFSTALHDPISYEIKQNILTHYFLSIQLKVLRIKNKKVRQLIKRADIHQLLTLIDLDKGMTKKFLSAQLQIDINTDNFE